MLQIEVLEKIKTHLMLNYPSPPSQIVPGELDRLQMTIWCMCIEFWITKATDTLLMCNTYCSLLQQGLHEHDPILCYMYIACPAYLTAQMLR